MGEKIKDIGKFSINNNEILIELNQGYNAQYSKYDIHIQSDHLQYYLPNRDFIQFATTLIYARERLNSLKKHMMLGSNGPRLLVTNMRNIL